MKGGDSLNDLLRLLLWIHSFGLDNVKRISLLQLSIGACTVTLTIEG